MDDRRDWVLEGVHVLVKMMAARCADHFAELRLVKAAQTALRVMDHHHLAGLHDRLPYSQRVQCVAGSPPSSVSNHVSIPRPEAQQGADVNTSIHAGQDCEVLNGFDYSGGAA